MNVSGLTRGVSALAAGYNHTCARATSGSLKCWGYNLYGQLGDNTPLYQVAPVNIASTSTSATYIYNEPAHKHAVKSLSTGEAFTYDANGNMTQRVENGMTYSQVFDAENRLVSVTVNNVETTLFVYDGQGNLVKRTDPDTSYTLYFFGLYEIHIAGGTETDTHYYPAGGAMRVTSGTNNTLSYILSDHLGSTSVVTDSNGNVMGTQGYYPFGETRYTTGSLFTDRLYTGQQALTSLGLYNYKARFYDSALGKFISPDSITPGGPQGLNRYSYVLNNPVNGTDPSGNKPCDPEYGCNASLPAVRATTTPDISSLSDASAILVKAGVDIYGTGWSEANIYDSANAVVSMGVALKNAGAGKSWYEAFRNIYGPMAFVWGLEYNGSGFSGDCANFGGGCSPGMINGTRVIAFNDLPNYTGLPFSTLVTHELGHIFSYSYGWSDDAHQSIGASDGASSLGSKWLNSPGQILFGASSPSTYQHASSSSGSEMFADMYTAWVFGVWNTDILLINQINMASGEMSTNIAKWIKAGRK